jgi:tetraacyldisaccharide 4'-kinase
MRRYLIQLATDARRDPLSRVFQGALWALSGLYRVILWVRSKAGRIWKFQPRDVGCPVISVGNLTWGGTGKTPLVQLIVNKLKKEGHRPGVLSRSGHDEVALLTEKLDGTPVAIGKDRYQEGRALREHCAVDRLVLDDGFQHTKIKKDLEILVLNSRRPFGNGNLIPRGVLREPVERLGRAQWILLNKIDGLGPDQRAHLYRDVRRIHPDAVIGESHYEVTSVVDMATQEEIVLTDLQAVPIALLSAIADPASFRWTTENRGLHVVSELIFADHHPFSRKDLLLAVKKARQNGAERVLVTEKDAVKIKPLILEMQGLELPIGVVEIGMKITTGEGFLDELLHSLPHR